MNPEMIKSSLYRIAHGIAAWCAATALLTSCEKAPDNVLGREEMASLMADIHMGEAVIDYNYSAFPTTLRANCSNRASMPHTEWMLPLSTPRLCGMATILKTTSRSTTAP